MYYRVFLWNATCSSFDKQCAQAYFITWLPSPTQRREWGKKADMFEGNVLVKKYRGGRQEDYLKKGFALFWDLPVDIRICFKFKVFMSYFEILFLCFSSNFTLHFKCPLCVLPQWSYQNFSNISYCKGCSVTFDRLFEWHCREFVTLVWGMGACG